MGHQAIIYGRIQEPWQGSYVRWPTTPEYNDGVLESLPDVDDHWPFLTRHMFHVAPRAYRGNSDRGEYRGRIVHFAASLKDSIKGEDWPLEFLVKLEREVLGKLLWNSAKVHFESTFFGERLYLYQSRQESIAALQAELETKQFGERIDATMSWNRQEVTQIRTDTNWLH